MKTKIFITISVFVVFALAFVLSSAKKETASENQLKKGSKVTFIELGSVNCIPCKEMQPVMASVEKKYGGQLSVIFYDVWKPEQKKYAEQYGVKLIPTQVFLDETGKEFFRHEGFFPESDIDSLLQKRGLTLLESSLNVPNHGSGL